MKSAHVITQMLDRIKRYDPLIRSIIEVNPDALSIAESIDAGAHKGLLAGIPVLLKDNIDTGDTMLTTAGSLALAKAPSPSDAHLVTALREAGAIILGKTNLSEWANIRSRHSSSGWSSRGGLTRNPHDLSRTASGSSSGSAAAVAAGFAPIAIGTETNGSIISPATSCGVVGFKPSKGRISQRGIVPISSTYDTAGPLTRSVRDAALAMSAMSGVDMHSTLSADALSGVRVGILTGPITYHDDLMDHLTSVMQTLQDLGATMVMIDDPMVLTEGWPHAIRVMLCELVWTMKSYLETRGDTVDVHSLEDIVNFNHEHADLTMPWFGQDLFEQALDLASEPRETYESSLATAHELAGSKGLDLLFENNNVDVLVGITDGPAGVIDLLNGESGRHVSLAPYPAVVGYPHLTVPGRHVSEMPIGVSFMGRLNADADVLRYGYAYEQVADSIIEPHLEEI